MAVNPLTVTSQPTTRRQEIEEHVKDLDPHSAQSWTEQEVIDNYLKPTGFGYLAKTFHEQHITGAALMSLQEKHLKEMNIALVGERVKFLEYLRLLKKHRRDAEKTKVLWSATTPVTDCAYHDKFCSGFCFHLCCPCCIPTTEWRINSQGIRWRKNPASIDCCGEVETQIIDFRFLKDIEFRKDPKCCCCCLDAKTLLYADDKDAVSKVQRTKNNAVEITPEAAPLVIHHPDAARAESIIRNIWAETKLVAD